MLAIRSVLGAMLILFSAIPSALADTDWDRAIDCLWDHVELSVEGLDQIDQRGEITITARNNTNIAFSRIGVRLGFRQHEPFENIQTHYFDVPMMVGSRETQSTTITLPYTHDLLVLLGKGATFQFQPGKVILPANPIGPYYVKVRIDNALDRKGRMVVNDTHFLGREPIFWPGAQATSQTCVAHYEDDDSASDLFMRFLNKLFD